jgi:membrane protein
MLVMVRVTVSRPPPRRERHAMECGWMRWIAGGRDEAQPPPGQRPRLAIFAAVATTKKKNQSLAAAVLRRGREQHLPQAAGGLTFATTISLVPLLAVSFALFARVPALRPTGSTIREQLLRGLLPVDIAKPVMKQLAQFTGNTGGLTALGLALLLLSALTLLLSVENTFNRIWQVKQPRPLLRRLALYLAVLLAGPVVVGASLWAASFAPVYGPLLLAAIGFSCLFRYVPHAPVRWREAITGGLLAASAFELGKRGFAIYLANVPTYKTIYGAFAPLLAFLVWIYYSWLVTLAGAVLSASLRRPRKTSAAA